MIQITLQVLSVSKEAGFPPLVYYDRSSDTAYGSFLNIFLKENKAVRSTLYFICSKLIFISSSFRVAVIS
jgi:hypothetical protein